MTTLTAEERAKARRACEEYHETAPEAYLADLLWKALDALEAADRERDDLAALVRRLLAPTQNAKCREQAEDYLRRHGLNGNPLRSGE